MNILHFVLIQAVIIFKSISSLEVASLGSYTETYTASFGSFGLYAMPPGISTDSTVDLTPIEQNEEIKVSGIEGSTKWYYFDLEEYEKYRGQLPMIQVTLSGGTGNAEIYVTHEELPTSWGGQVSNVAGCSNEDIDADNEECCHIMYQVGRFYIMIFGISDYENAMLKWELVLTPWRPRQICENTKDPYVVTSRDSRDDFEFIYFLEEWKLKHISGMDIIAWNDGHKLTVFDPEMRCEILNFGATPENGDKSVCSYNSSALISGELDTGYYYIQVYPDDFTNILREYYVNVLLRLYYAIHWRLYYKEWRVGGDVVWRQRITLDHEEYIQWCLIFYSYACIGTDCWFIHQCCPDEWTTTSPGVQPSFPPISTPPFGLPTPPPIPVLLPTPQPIPDIPPPIGGGDVPPPPLLGRRRRTRRRMADKETNDYLRSDTSINMKDMRARKPRDGKRRRLHGGGGWNKGGSNWNKGGSNWGSDGNNKWTTSNNNKWSTNTNNKWSTNDNKWNTNNNNNWNNNNNNNWNNNNDNSWPTPKPAWPTPSNTPPPPSTSPPSRTPPPTPSPEPPTRPPQPIGGNDECLTVPKWDCYEQEWEVKDFAELNPETGYKEVDVNIGPLGTWLNIEQCIGQCTAVRDRHIIYYFGNVVEEIGGLEGQFVTRYNTLSVYNEYEVLSLENNDLILNNPPTAINQGCVTQNDDGDIYLIGATGQAWNRDTLDYDLNPYGQTLMMRYSFDLNQWITEINHPVAQLTAMSCAYVDEGVYTFGGLIDSGGFTAPLEPQEFDGIYRFDIVSRTWSDEIGKLMFPNWGMRTAVDTVAGAIFLFGGYGYSQVSLVDSTDSTFEGLEINLDHAFRPVFIDTSLSTNKSLVQMFDWKTNITRFETSFFYSTEVQEELIEEGFDINFNFWFEYRGVMTRLLATYMTCENCVWSRNITWCYNVTNTTTCDTPAPTPSPSTEWPTKPPSTTAWPTTSTTKKTQWPTPGTPVWENEGKGKASAHAALGHDNNDQGGSAIEPDDDHNSGGGYGHNSFKPQKPVINYGIKQEPATGDDDDNNDFGLDPNVRNWMIYGGIFGILIFIVLIKLACDNMTQYKTQLNYMNGVASKDHKAYIDDDDDETEEEDIDDEDDNDEHQQIQDEIDMDNKQNANY